MEALLGSVWTFLEQSEGGCDDVCLGLRNGGKRRVEKGACMETVEPEHGYLAWNGDSAACQPAQHPECAALSF